MQFLQKLFKKTTSSSTDALNNPEKAITLWQACQRNDLEYIKQYLPQLTTGDINYQHQSENNCTALHEATRQQNVDIIKLLLKHGADRSLKNNNGETPIALSSTDEIRKLFKRPESDQRFIYSSNSLLPSISCNDKKYPKICSLHEEKACYEWALVDSNAAQTSINFRRELKPYKTDKELKRRIYTIKKGYLEMRLGAMFPESTAENKENIISIRNCFKDALDNSDPTHIVRAYTRQQKFSKLLNSDMARNVIHDLHFACSKLSCICSYTTEDGTKAIASILLHCDQLLDYPEGTVYRGMYVRSDLIAKYNSGGCIITTTFLSTSLNKDIANIFSSYDDVQKQLDTYEEGYASFLCIYRIKNYNNKKRTAINIIEYSHHPDEEEILILPYSAFLIKKRTTIPIERGERIEIELEECSDDQLIEYTNYPDNINLI